MGAAYAAGYALGKLKTAGDSCALRALRLAVPCGPAIAGREARSRQRRRLNCRDGGGVLIRLLALNTGRGHCRARSEEPTSELQSLMRIPYAVFCLNKNNKQQHTKKETIH